VSPKKKLRPWIPPPRTSSATRSFILNEAVDQYLSLQEYHLALIDEGIRAADAGDVVPHSEVMKMVASWSKKKKSA